MGARAGKYKLGAMADKYKLGTMASKYKLGARAGKYKLGARVGGRGSGSEVGAKQMAGVREMQRPFVIGAVLTDLSIAFKCIPRDLLIPKLEAYGLRE